MEAKNKSKDKLFTKGSWLKPVTKLGSKGSSAGNLGQRSQETGTGQRNSESDATLCEESR